MNLTADGWKIEVFVPPRAAAFFEQAFEPFCMALVSFEVEENILWRVEGYTLAPPPSEALTAAIAIAAARAGVPEPEAVCLPLPATDWVAETQRSFQPLRAGRYFVQPSHFEGTAPAGAHVILLDAGAAFGTGEHATTKGCLLALDRLARTRRFAKPLDLGCGSGILSIAAALTWHAPVMAADIDLRSVAVARANARQNRVAGQVTSLCSNGFAARAIRQAAPYDLILANILARPLVALSYAIRRHIAPNGVCVLSGLLAHQEREVGAAYRRQGFHLVRRLPIDGWHTLVLAR
ncbi:MAG: 50S ribosomal protein L11 methyltransferase [Alphaproteobacteria bacterium]